MNNKILEGHAGYVKEAEREIARMRSWNTKLKSQVEELTVELGAKVFELNMLKSIIDHAAEVNFDRRVAEILNQVKGE